MRLGDAWCFACFYYQVATTCEREVSLQQEKLNLVFCSKRGGLGGLFITDYWSIDPSNIYWELSTHWSLYLDLGDFHMNTAKPLSS